MGRKPIDFVFSSNYCESLHRAFAKPVRLWYMGRIKDGFYHQLDGCLFEVLDEKMSEMTSFLTSFLTSKSQFLDYWAIKVMSGPKWRK